MKNKAVAELESIHPYLPGIIREIQDDITQWKEHIQKWNTTQKSQNHLIQEQIKQLRQQKIKQLKHQSNVALYFTIWNSWLLVVTMWTYLTPLNPNINPLVVILLAALLVLAPPTIMLVFTKNR